MHSFLTISAKWKYELLLIALLQHLFIGIFITDLAVYATIIWPINMIILGIASVGVFLEKGKWKNIIRSVLIIVVVAFPLCLPFFSGTSFFSLLNITYVLFYVFIFLEVFKFLIKPSYINSDIISAAACGYLLLIEISVFIFQSFYYANPISFKGLDDTSHSTIFTDLVYFCTITLTSIGFGDITPNSHHTKLLTAVFGIAGQFYSVVLVGILISKFSSTNKQ
jgi:hypothetical protein